MFSIQSVSFQMDLKSHKLETPIHFSREDVLTIGSGQVRCSSYGAIISLRIVATFCTSKEFVTLNLHMGHSLPNYIF